jgi:hypothetical protein
MEVSRVLPLSMAVIDAPAPVDQARVKHLYPPPSSCQDVGPQEGEKQGGWGGGADQSSMFRAACCFIGVKFSVTSSSSHIIFANYRPVLLSLTPLLI